MASSQKPCTTHELKQKVFTSIDKLSDRATFSQASSELNYLAKTLSLDFLPSFLSCILSIDSSSKSPVRVHCITLLSILSDTHKSSLSPHIHKISQFLVRRLRDSDTSVRNACVCAVSTLSHLNFTSLLETFLGSISIEQDLNTQIGCCLCLKGVIENGVLEEREEGDLRKRVLPKVMKLLKSDGFKAKGALLGVIQIVVGVNDGVVINNNCKSLVGNVVDLTVEMLSSEDWMARKSAAEVLLKMALVLDDDSAAQVKIFVVNSLDSRRFDKVKVTREIMNRALEAWREVPGGPMEEIVLSRSNSSISKESGTGGVSPSIPRRFSYASSETPKPKKRMAKSRSSLSDVPVATSPSMSPSTQDSSIGLETPQRRTTLSKSRSSLSDDSTITDSSWASKSSHDVSIQAAQSRKLITSKNRFSLPDDLAVTKKSSVYQNADSKKPSDWKIKVAVLHDPSENIVSEEDDESNFVKESSEKRVPKFSVSRSREIPFFEENKAPQRSELVSESAGAGTTKRKELHGTVHLRALSGTWRDSPHGAVFHVYKIDFSCDSELYSGFVLLTESKLDDDVANNKVDLYLLDKMVKSTVIPCGEIHLGSDQIKRAMHFHELLFNGLYGKLFQGSKASGIHREFLLQRDNDLLWSTSYMYMILPLEVPNIVNDDDSWRINWKGIDSCVSVVEFLRNSAWLSAEQSRSKYRSLSGDSSAVGGNVTGEDIIYLADRSLSTENLKETVVMSIHTGRIYYVLDILVNTSAESPFDSKADGTPSKYPSFADYFNKKYGIVLFYPGQPLLLLKQTHNPFNLLSDSEASAFRRKMLSTGNPVDAKRNNTVHMPPELLVCIDIDISLLRALYLIPSLIHRMESLMLACQLREDISYNVNRFHMPSSLILEALTTLRCCEDFSSERLELLGDSVLKYAVSCHLFLKYPQKHEGKLSGQRQRTIGNANLHELGTKRRIHAYIRDSAFEPRRWVAPGQLSVHPVPCSHGVDTSEVPLDSKYRTIDENVVIGKSCDRGHRWLVSKSIADCVEALIGAYYVGGGLMAALHMMNWLGIEVNLEPCYVEKAINLASDRSCNQKVDHVTALESKIGYDFSTKGLLLEAITHLTEKDSGVGYCYERLEFLGDAVLDVLITWHLYQNHTDVDPGELTDLRSASVSNENFAQVCVRRNLFQHLQHCSESISKQITEYVTLVMAAEDSKSLQGRQCPKVLGDLFESIAGAILIDTKLNVEELWRIFLPLLSPIVTPDNLELPPFRELNELCDCLGYFFKEHCENDKEVVLAELRLQLEDILLIGEGIGKIRKTAKGQAALHLLKELESRGISYDRCVLKRKKRESSDVSSGLVDMKFSIIDVSQKKQKVSQLLCGDDGVSDAAIPVIAAISTEKGGPRNSLYELCKRLQWPMPSFETIEQKSRAPIEFGEGSDKKTGFNSFMSKISLLIPDFGVMEVNGEERADKKRSQDSAALHLLYKLEEQGKLVIS